MDSNEEEDAVEVALVTSTAVTVPSANHLASILQEIEQTSSIYNHCASNFEESKSDSILSDHQYRQGEHFENIISQEGREVKEEGSQQSVGTTQSSNPFDFSDNSTVNSTRVNTGGHYSSSTEYSNHRQQKKKTNTNQILSSFPNTKTSTTTTTTWFPADNDQKEEEREDSSYALNKSDRGGYALPESLLSPASSLQQAETEDTPVIANRKSPVFFMDEPDDVTFQSESSQKIVSKKIILLEDPLKDCSELLQNLYCTIERERQIHNLTALNLRAVNNWIIFPPSIGFTLLSGIIALISESSVITNEESRLYLLISVGILALLSVVWQGFNKIGGRALLHEAASNSLRKLADEILLVMSSNETDIEPEFVSLINSKFIQITEGSSYSTLSCRVETAFDTVHYRLLLILSPMHHSEEDHPNKLSNLDKMNYHKVVYDELSSRIVQHWKWPFHLPAPRKSADSTMSNFKKIVSEVYGS